MSLGWASVGLLVGAGPSRMIPDPPISTRHCCWRSCVLPSVQPARPPSTSFTTYWPALTVHYGELGQVRAWPLVWGSFPCRTNLSVYPCRTELHFNHLAENNVFGIAPVSKVTTVGLSGGLW